MKFGNRRKKRDEEARLLDELAGLRRTLEEARAETDIGVQLEDAKQTLADKRIEISELEEAHERKMREIEHKVGLQAQKAEQDQAAAVRDARLEVREANLETERSQLENQIKFQREEMEKRTSSIEGLLEQVLTALPRHKHSVHEFVGNAPGRDTSRAVAELDAGGKDED